MSADEYILEQWVFLGRFWDSKHGYVYRWQTSEDEQVAYKKLKATVIGGVYDVHVKRKDDGVSAKNDVNFTGETIDGGLRAILLSNHEEATRDKAKLDAEKRFASSAPLDRAMEPIESMARNCRTIDEMDALIAVTRSRIIKAWRDR